MTDIYDEAGQRPIARDWRLLIQVVLGFWALHLVYRITGALIGARPGELLDPALHAALTCGFLLSIGFCLLLRLAVRRGLVFGLGAAAVLSVVFSMTYAAGELALFLRLSPEVNGVGATRTMADGTVITTNASGAVSYRKPGEKRATVVKLSPVKQRVLAQAPHIVLTNGGGWSFFYFGLGSFFVGMSSASRLRRAERRAAEYERLAHASQLRALRYQVNPHFLFNTLNSLSALILSRRTEQAETMILNLSSFFRSSLAVDPTDDIALSDEIALQRLYLDIESARFPDRLRVVVDVPRELAQAQVPALLLQPLVENAIKYGVARTEARVTIRIAAEEHPAGRLRLVVENDRRGEAESEGGTGVGLRNVGERLEARFGGAATCAHGVAGDVYRVTLTMPLVRA